MRAGRRPLFWALAASLLLHMSLLFGPQIELPAWSTPAPLTVELAEPPPKPKTVAAVVKQVKRIRPAQKPAPEVAPSVAPTPEAPVAPTPVAQESGTPPEPPAAPAPPATPEAASAPAEPMPIASFPSRLTLRYTAYAGEGGFLAGHTVHQWRVERNQYLITSVTEAVGLAALFLRGEYRQTSRGEIGATGLVPMEFWVQRGQEGRRTEGAEFDWTNHRLNYGKSNDKREISLAPGAQDQLSVFYQLALTAPFTESVQLLLTNGRKVYLYEYRVLGDETIDTPLGKLKTQHLARVVPDSEQGGADVWLAYDYHFLPVRFRLKPGGRLLDHVIEEIRAE